MVSRKSHLYVFMNGLPIGILSKAIDGVSLFLAVS